MDYAKMQKQLDMQKWAMSEERNEDMCGKMAYCGHCVKNEEHPCAKAYEKAENAAKTEKAVKAEKPAAKKAATTEKKPAAKKTAATAAKKPAAKKTAAK